MQVKSVFVFIGYVSAAVVQTMWAPSQHQQLLKSSRNTYKKYLMLV